MRFGDDLRRDVSDELFLGLERVLAIRGQPEAFAEAEDMRINRHRRLVPDDGAHDVRGLASYALERLQLLYCDRPPSGVAPSERGVRLWSGGN